MRRASSTELVSRAKQVSQILTKFHVKHWLEFGSLLGAVRSRRIIPWDHDIDFGCLASDRSRILGLHGEFRRLKLNIDELSGKLIRLTSSVAAPGRIQWIDLYPCVERGSDLVPLPVPGTRFKCLHVDELQHIRLEGLNFPCPRYAGKLLALRYGDTWQVPITRGFEIKNEPGASSTSAYVNEGPEEGRITGYTEGVFDLFHLGHVELLRRGKELFDRLVVGVNSDETARKYKRQPIVPYEQRLTMIRSCKYVDEVIGDAPMVTSLRFMRRHGLDYVLHGRAPVRWLDQFYAEPRAAGRLHLVAETSGIHTTFLIRRIGRILGRPKKRLRQGGSQLV